MTGDWAVTAVPVALLLALALAANTAILERVVAGQQGAVGHVQRHLRGV